MKRVLILLVSFIFASGIAVAKKKVTVKTRFKEAYTALKDKKGQETAARVLADSLSSVDLPPKQRAGGYYLCARLMDSENEVLNLKAYLNEKLDTAKLFQTVYDVYDYTVKCNLEDAGAKYAFKVHTLRHRHRENLFQGGQFMLGHKRYGEAYKFFDMYLNTVYSDGDRHAARASYLASYCGIHEHKDEHTLKHIDLAIATSDASSRAVLSEFKARSVVATGDSARWVSLLESGVRTYPGNSYFYNKLMDYYIHKRMFDRGMSVTDSLINADSDRTIYWETKSLIALAREDYPYSIKMSDFCLERDPENVNALYNKGAAYLDMALKEKDKVKRIQYYSQALEPMEMMRRLEPGAINKWGSALYRIYLNLNMGEKFDEIDRILSNY